jgi:hypothetical protein
LRLKNSRRDSLWLKPLMRLGRPQGNGFSLRARNLRLRGGRRAHREKDKKPRDRRYAGPRAAAPVSATPFGSLPRSVTNLLELLLWIEHWIRHA